MLQHLNLEEKDFLSLWITFWTAVITLCGLFPIKATSNQPDYTQEQLNASKAQVKADQEKRDIQFNQQSLNLHQKQIELQTNLIIEEQYNSLRTEIASNNDIIQLEAVKDLFNFAIEQDNKYKCQSSVHSRVY